MMARHRAARWPFGVLAVLCLVGGRLAGQTAPQPRSPAAPPPISLTIYNDGRVLVRRTVPLAIPKGASEQRVALGPLDPATLFSLEPGVAIVGAQYDGTVDETSVMRRAIGRDILFRTSPTDTLRATVVGVDPERFRLTDGRMLFGRPGQPVFPADLVVTDPSLQLAVRSETARQDLRLGYFAGGARWEASYSATLGPRGARVTGLAVIHSDSLRAVEAEVQLLAGAVARAEREPEPPRPLMARAAEAAQTVADFAAEQRVGAYRLYTLPGRTTLEPGTATSVALFAPATVAYERAYVVRGQLPYWGVIPREPGQDGEVPVEVGYTLRRPRKSEFGDRPLPAGVLRLYQADSTGRAQLVGEAATWHTPPGEDVRVTAGQAFDLTARRTQTSYTTRRDSTRAGVRTIALADYAVTLRNATDSAVTIEVHEERAGEWSIVSSSVPAEKVSATLTRFRVPVPAGGEATLTYRVRAVW